MVNQHPNSMSGVTFRHSNSSLCVSDSGINDVGSVGGNREPGLAGCDWRIPGYDRFWKMHLTSPQVYRF